MTFLKEKRESEVPFVAQYSIAAGIAYASENKDKFNSLRHKTSDNELSEDYKLCAKHYHTALVNLKKAEMFLESEDFGEVNVSTVSAVKSLNECGSLMGRGFDETISKRHTDLIYVADIIFDTASVLLNTSSSVLSFITSISLQPYLKLSIFMPPNSNSSMISSSSSSHHSDMPDLKSIWVLITINKHIVEAIEKNEKTRNSLKLRCSSRLRIQKQEFFEFSEQQVLSNLYWAIDAIEAAIQTQEPEERSFRLSNTEQMLQVPAMLDEEGVTATVPNRYLLCCSYFYLSVVRKLRGDEWQAALHFLQAVLVSPRLVCTEFAPQLCETLFPSVFSAKNSQEDVNKAIRGMARRYKECLMYYRVMLYGDTPWWRRNGPNISRVSSDTAQHELRLQTCNNYEKIHPLDHLQEDEKNVVNDVMAHESKGFMNITKRKDHRKATSAQVQSKEHQKISSLKDMLKKAQSSKDFRDRRDLANMDDSKCHITYKIANEDDLQPEASDWKLHQNPLQELSYERNIVTFGSRRFTTSMRDLASTISEYGDIKCKFDVDNEIIEEELQLQKFHLFDHIAFTSPHKHRFSQRNLAESSERKLQRSSGPGSLREVCSHSGRDSISELAGPLERKISILHHSEALGNCVEDYIADIASIYDSLSGSSSCSTYDFLKDVILDELLMAISTSKEEKEIRASVSILTTIISRNKSIIEDIKKKGLKLYDLASALKQNVHEAAILIYLINPSPIDIKTLELLPTLMEIVCTSHHSYKSKSESLLLTPHAASLMIIEELVTSFDYATNNTHLAAISSPQVLGGLLEVARNDNLKEFFSLTTILIKCMQFDAQCRKYVSQFTPLAPFIQLLQTENNRAKHMALEFLHEILCIPRSSAISLLQRMQKEGGTNVMQILMLCVHQLQSDHQLLAANILLQLDTLNSHGKSVLSEEAVQVLLRGLASQESSEQILSASILSNLAGTYAWTGESYTSAWLLKKTGLTSPYRQNMIRNFNWLDQCLQDSSTDLWCSKIARYIISIGDSIFHALDRGLRSKIKKLSRDCLVAIAWLGCHISKSPDSLRYFACEILLGGIEQFLHPGMELEERLLACLCIYNYTSGKGMQKLIHFSEGVKESLRRLSNVTWMAEELHRVADYLLPNISRISCVHTQILEAGHNIGIAVSSLIFYKGLLFSGYYDGSIKVWDIRGHSATLVWDIKEHKKSVTCFSLSEPSDSLLSGSADKTIRVWKMIQRKLECIEVIAFKEPIHRLHAHGQTLFVITQGQGMKLVDESRTTINVFKGKHVKCMAAAAQGKFYAGCTDSSIQEYSMTYNREVEIKAPMRSWMKQNRPINSVVAYRDWLYSASRLVEGSTFQDWKRNGKPHISFRTEKGDSLVAMEVVEDFLYLISSSSTSNIQIWLRRTQKKVGRISAGSKITSLLSANDIILCGTEMGLIKLLNNRGGSLYRDKGQLQPIVTHYMFCIQI
ncbi:putative E3 ubiquitin-protein ligase LIN-1 [Senna tora]|uniref:Putative E3 ubiquitin-protein ligase LIN-1 n=1 Tax=Senna tora TaxID=362788 RepID=A0A835CDU9_9FABA|nr:putative E3 ubiquitin-protein ligase LIN-1 [Senna tora]